MDNSVSKEEITRLISYKNAIIGQHINNCDKSLERLKAQRGEQFIDAMIDSSLNTYDTLLISSYADFIASDLNRDLRSTYKKRNDAYMLYEFLLNKSLSKIKSESCSNVFVVYQCGDYEDKLYSWYERRLGETVQFPNFLSTSRAKWTNRNFYLEIKTHIDSSGKYIAPSQMPQLSSIPHRLKTPLLPRFRR